ncbi:MAG: hypothetical protein JXA68_00205 [Ignavibacteriales bacterium]|nr:hypothetical protein [Ignavibacteriales bacterium]
MTEQELLILKQDIEKAKTELSKMLGRKETLLEQLQKKFNVNSVSEAEKKAQQFEKEIEEWVLKIEVATEELENKLEKIDTDEN